MNKPARAKRFKKPYLPGSSPDYSTVKKSEKVRITVIDYDEASCQQKEVTNIEECFSFRNTPTVTWINIDGIYDTEIIEKIGKHFDLHPIILEDIAKITQRPKFEDMDKYIYLVFKMLDYNDKELEIVPEQMSIILGNNFVISFQEAPGDIFDSIRERIKTDKGRIRKMGSDYLMYALIDANVDSYFSIIEKLGEQVVAMEDELLINPNTKILHTIQKLKSEMMYIRKSVWPLREAINSLERSESDLIKQATGIYLRDTYDHTIQVIDALETYRDTLSGMLEIYLSSISNKLNEVMKVLTVISTIFMPLTFLAGLYGMNFKHMPELELYWTYPLLIVVMLAIALSMVAYFKRKKWI